jgi:fructose/tagatose bisphosphate aldolase
MKNPLRWLFHRRAKAPIERCSVEELKQVKQESDYLAAAIDSTHGLLKPEDMERLKRFTENVDKINQRGE